MNRSEQLYHWVVTSYLRGEMKSVWLQFNDIAITQTGSAPMQIAG